MREEAYKLQTELADILIKKLSSAIEQITKHDDGEYKLKLNKELEELKQIIMPIKQ